MHHRPLMICTAMLGCDLSTSVAAQGSLSLSCGVRRCSAHRAWCDPSCRTLQRHEGSVAPGAHSRNVSRELRESSEGARSAILLAADDAEAGVTQQGPAEQSAAEHSAAEQNAAEHIAAEQNAAELSAAMLSADPPQLLPALDGMDAGPSSGASGAAQGGASCQEASLHCS